MTLSLSESVCVLRGAGLRGAETAEELIESGLVDLDAEQVDEPLDKRTGLGHGTSGRLLAIAGLLQCHELKNFSIAD